MSDQQEPTENKIVEVPTQQEEQESVSPVAVVEETITFTLILPEPQNEELNHNNNHQEEEQKQQQSASHGETENTSTSAPEQKQEEREAILVVEEVTTTTMLPVETSKGEANEEKPRQESEGNDVSETEKSPKATPEQQQTTNAEPQVITEVVVSFIPVVVIVEEVKEEVQQEKEEASAKAEILPDNKKTEDVKPAENKEVSSSSTAPATYQHEDYSAYSNESASAETVRLHELRKQNTIDRNINDLASSSNEYDHYSELDDKIPREGIIPSKKDRNDAAGAAPNSHQKIRSRCTGAVSLSKEALVCEKCAFRKSGYNCVICDKFAPCVYNSSLGSGHKGIQGGLCSRCDKSHCVVCDGKLPVMSWNKQKYAALLCASCGDGGLARRCCKMVEVDEENSVTK